MFGWLIPGFLKAHMKVVFRFEDRMYNFGESITLIVDIEFRRDVVLREACIELVCDERHVESYAGVEVLEPPAGLISPRRKGPPVMVVPRRHVAETRNMYVHSGTVFIEDKQMEQGTRFQCKVDLEIERKPLSGIVDSDVRWTLVTKMDTNIGTFTSREQKVAIQTGVQE